MKASLLLLAFSSLVAATILPATLVPVPIASFSSGSSISVTYTPNNAIATYADISLGVDSTNTNCPMGVFFLKAAPGGTSYFNVYWFSTGGTITNNPSINFVGYDYTKPLVFTITQDGTYYYGNLSQPGGYSYRDTIPFNSALSIPTVLRLVCHDSTYIWPITTIQSSGGLKPPVLTTLPIATFTSGSSLSATFSPNNGIASYADISVGASSANTNVALGLYFDKAAPGGISTFYAYAYSSTGVFTQSNVINLIGYNYTLPLVMSISLTSGIFTTVVSQPGGPSLSNPWPGNLVNGTSIPTLSALRIACHDSAWIWPINILQSN